MKYCLKATQTEDILKLADEIKVQWPDRESIIDLVDLNPQATIVLNISPAEYSYNPPTIESIHNYHKVCAGRFIVLGPTYNLISECAKLNIKCGSSVPIRELETLDKVIALGATSVLIASPLTHMLETFKALRYENIQVRMVVNDAEGIERYWDGFTSGWVRPEDIDKLAEFVDVCEFDSESRKQEKALYEVYKKKSWPGGLQFIIHNLFVEHDIANAAIDPEFFDRRFDCHMRCVGVGHCQYCRLVSNYLASRDYITMLKNNLEEMKNEPKTL